ncbi:integrase [Xanthomonas arboricola pv. juglandis]|nr:integrase [Xanthomonas arboricola pv. juglandis]
MQSLLGAGYARLFAQLTDQRVDKLSKTDADLLIARLTSSENLQDLTLNRTRQPDGTVTEQWQIDSPKDLKLYRQLMELEAMAGAALQARAHPVALPTMFGSTHAGPNRQSSAPAIETMTLGKARDAFLATLKGSTLPKTYTIKKTAIEALVSFLGEKAKVHAITRSDLARWYQDMREKGASTPTLTNKQSYIGGRGGFFEWAMASGHYPKGDNPASGHVSYSQREKRARKKLSFKAYDRAQIQTLFAPEALAKLSESARWASLIGLYTGARASEVGQFLVKDVFEEEGIACIRISDEGEHQKVKTEVSLRTVPLHPELLKMGFLRWVERKRKAGETRLFPAAKATAVNGQEIGVVTAFRDAQWILKNPNSKVPGLNLGLSGNTEGPVVDALASLGERYYIFEFKSDQSKCSDEWDSKGWAKDAHVKLMSLCRSIEVAPYDYDLRKLLKRVWMTASTRLRVRGLLRSDSK